VSRIVDIADSLINTIAESSKGEKRLAALAIGHLIERGCPPAEHRILNAIRNGCLNENPRVRIGSSLLELLKGAVGPLTIYDIAHALGRNTRHGRGKITEALKRLSKKTDVTMDGFGRWLRRRPPPAPLLRAKHTAPVRHPWTGRMHPRKP
jgi:hypothetical protein